MREVLRYLKLDRGVEIHHDGDLPARSGMGSSSSFTVGLLNALYALKGVMPTKHELTTQSIHIEQEMIRETVGSQDQTLAAYGGFNHVQFLQNGEIAVRPVIMTTERSHQLNAHLMLFYTGIKRTAADVAGNRAAADGLLLLDVDGVLTDGRLTYAADGSVQKSFHTKDGFGIRPKAVFEGFLDQHQFSLIPRLKGEAPCRGLCGRSGG